MGLRTNQIVAEEKIDELKDKAQGIIQNEMHSKENREPKTKQRTNQLWENRKQLNVCIIGEPKGKKGKGPKKHFLKIQWPKFFQI